MIEVDENDKIENMNLDFDQGDWVGHVGVVSHTIGLSFNIDNVGKTKDV